MRKNLNMVFHLTDQEKKELTTEIQSFYLDVRGEEIGIIQSQQILDLFMENLAPVIYNKALDDVHRWGKQMADNLESDFYTLYKTIR